MVQDCFLSVFIGGDFQKNPSPKVDGKLRVGLPICLGCYFLPSELWAGGVSQMVDEYVSKVVSTHLWNTPLNLSQQAVKGILS